MGVGAAQSVRRRQRATAARVARLVAGQTGPDATDAGRRAKRRSLVREVRRCLRAHEAARKRTLEAEVRAGTALVRLAAGGLGLNKAAASVGLSRGAARRLVAVAASTGEPRHDPGNESLSEPGPDQDRSSPQREEGLR